MTGGELIARSLAAHGVDTVFGIPGTHNLGIYAHLTAAGIRHVSPRHEQGAGYAADGYARAGRRPGVAIVTSGPALLNVAAAAGQAQSDSVPLLVISPGLPRDHPEGPPTGFLHEMRSQQRAMRGVVGHSIRAQTLHELAVELAAAFTRFASERPGAAYLDVPLDLLDAEDADADVVVALTHRRAVAEATAVARAAALVSGASAPVIVAGGGAQGASAWVTAVAERLGAPVLTTVNGKGVLDERHPLALGARLPHRAARELLAAADVILAIGTELAESDLWVPFPPLAGSVIRIDLDPGQADMNVASAIALTGDAAETLQALVAAMDPAPAPPDHGHARACAVRAALDTQTREEAAPWQAALDVLADVFAPDTILAGDSAMVCYLGLIPGWRAAGPSTMLHPTGFGTLGYGLPAAIGAKLARPDRDVVAVMGDGGLMFTVAELATAAALGICLPVIVAVNGGYGEIRREMVERGQEPLGVDLPVPDLPALATALGAHGALVSDPATLRAELERARTHPGPSLIAIPEPFPHGDG